MVLIGYVRGRKTIPSIMPRVLPENFRRWIMKLMFGKYV
jgi:hypothetical protein